MITQYTKPVEQEFISQYVPIPFEQLNRVTDAYARDYKESSDKLDSFIKEYGKFRSASNADMKNYQDLTVGKLKEVVDKVGSSSDMLTSAEGRSLLASTIRGIDYGALNALQQTAEELDKENKLRMEMEANGKQIDYRFYDPNKAANYNTLKEGKPYKAQVPVEHIPLKKLFDPLYDQIKPNVITKGLYTYKEITPSMLAKVTTDENIKQFMENPVIDREVAYNHANGIIPSKYYRKNSDGDVVLDKKAYVKDLAIQSQAARVGVFDKEVDQLALKAYEASQKNAVLGNAMQSGALNRTNEIRHQVETTLQSKVNGLHGKKISNSDIANGVEVQLTPLDFKSLNERRFGAGSAGYETDRNVSLKGVRVINPKTGKLVTKTLLDKAEKNDGEQLLADIETSGVLNTSAGRVLPKNIAKATLNFKEERDGSGKLIKRVVKPSVDEYGNRSYHQGISQTHDILLYINNDGGWSGGDYVLVNGKRYNVDEVINGINAEKVKRDKASYLKLTVNEDILQDQGSAGEFDVEYLNANKLGKLIDNPNLYENVRMSARPFGGGTKIYGN